MTRIREREISEENSWQIWGKYILKELERLNATQEKIDTRLNKIERDIVALKMRAGIWGLIAGMIPAIGALLWIILRE